MKLPLRHRISISSALIIVLCAMTGGFMNQENHDKMSAIHEEKIQLVKNDKKDMVEKRRGKRVII